MSDEHAHAPTVGSDPPPLDRRRLQHLASRGASWTLIHTVVSVPIAFLGNLALARFLGVADYGRLAFLSLLMTVAGGIVELGLGSALIQFGSRAHAAGRRDEVRTLLSASQGFRLLVVAPLLSVVILTVARVDSWLLLIAIVFGIWMPAALDGALFCTIIEGRSAASAKIAMVTNLVSQVVTVAVAAVLPSPDVIWAVRLVISGLHILLFFASTSPDYRRAVLAPKIPPSFPAGFWRFAIPTGVASLIGTLALSRSEVFFLNWLSTPEAVGLFALSFGLAAHIFSPADALVGPLIPAIGALHEVDEQAVRPAFQRVLRISSTVVSLACGIGLPALALLVPVLYGADFAAAGPMLLVLGGAGAVLTAGGPLSAFTMGRMSGRRLVVANATALAVDVALAIALIPGLDAWGAVIANAAGALTRLGILLAGEVGDLELTWRSTLGLVLPSLLSIPLAAATWAVGSALPPAYVPALVCGSCLVLVGALHLTRTGLTRGDRDVLARALPGPLARPAAPLLGLLTWRVA